jgi:hypothetical protein
VISPVVQRWRSRRDSYRPAGEPIATRLYEVAPIADDSTPKAFVVAHHYLASYPAARRRFGLYRGAELVGVAVFSVPANNATLAVFPAPPDESMELGRLVLVDEVPANGETWFLGRAFELLRREGFAGVVSFSDPFPRRDVAGAVVFPGHVGTIYQAFNANYRGRAKADTLRLLPDGRTLSNRALAKLRKLDRGWRYVVELLQGYGAGAFSGDPRAWLNEWLPRLTRKVRHPGNHKYVWALRRDVRRHIPESLPYPKFLPEVA